MHWIELASLMHPHIQRFVPHITVGITTLSYSFLFTSKLTLFSSMHQNTSVPFLLSFPQQLESSNPHWNSYQILEGAYQSILLINKMSLFFNKPGWKIFLLNKRELKMCCTHPWLRCGGARPCDAALWRAPSLPRTPEGSLLCVCLRQCLLQWRGHDNCSSVHFRSLALGDIH